LLVDEIEAAAEIVDPGSRQQARELGEAANA
jgi:hypothetical protein